MGATASAAAGGLFYHTILASLGQIESLVLAVLFPLVVTGTFVASEMYKDAQEAAIKEGFSGGALTETAIREETRLQSALAVHQKVVAYLEKPEAALAIEAGAKSLLHDILAELRETSRQLSRQTIVPRDTDDPTRQLPFALLERTEEEGSEASTERHDNQAEAPLRHLPVSSPTYGPDATHADEGRDDGDPGLPDPTPFPVPQNIPWQHDRDAGDSAGFSRHQPEEQPREPLSKQNLRRSPSKTTPGHDLTTSRILAYLAEHHQAKQTEIAEALGVTVRTVQRKLAALRKQEAVG